MRSGLTGSRQSKYDPYGIARDHVDADGAQSRQKRAAVGPVGGSYAIGTSQGTAASIKAFSAARRAAEEAAIALHGQQADHRQARRGKFRGPNRLGTAAGSAAGGGMRGGGESAPQHRVTWNPPLEAPEHVPLRIQAAEGTGGVVIPTRLAWWLVTPSSDGRLDEAADAQDAEDSRASAGVGSGSSPSDGSAAAQADDSARGRSVLVVGGLRGQVCLLDCNEVWRKAIATVKAGMAATTASGVGGADSGDRAEPQTPGTDWGSQVLGLVGLGTPSTS